MKKHNLVIAMGMASLMVALPASANTGKVTFNGAIIDSPCSIAPGASDQTVDMGQISTEELKTGGESNARPFSIKLENCTISTGKDSVKVTFSGTKDANYPELLGLGGTARGAGIAMYAPGGAKVVLDTPTAVYKISNGNNQLDFAAVLKGYTAHDAAKPLVAGDFTATTNFLLSYQ